MKVLHKLRSYGRQYVLHPLGAMLLAFVALLAFLIIVHPNTKYTDLDGYILVFISFVFTMAALFMISRTSWSNWTVLSAGLLSTFVADAVLYGMSGASQLVDGWVTPTEGLAFIRTGFVIGGIWICVGLVCEWYLDQPHDQRSIGYIIKHPHVIFLRKKEK